MRLAGKIALVTGAGRGVGKSIAAALGREGASVVVCDADRDRLAAAAREIELEGPCLPIACDVASPQSVRRMFAEIREHFGALHILVNNPGLLATRPHEEERREHLHALPDAPLPRQSPGIIRSLSDEDWLRYWDANVHSVFYCTREALAFMEPQREGKIVNLTSVAAIAACGAFDPSYAAAGAAVVSLTRSVAADVAGANIYVNCIACGLPPPVAEDRPRPDSREDGDRILRTIPLGRFGRNEDYASLAVYLASDEHYLVGQTISPNGGLAM